MAKVLAKTTAIEAIRKAGTITAACDMLGISRNVWYRHAKTWGEDVQIALEEAREELVDKAEQSLADLIADRNVAATLFALKTLGRRRGYIERHEIAGVDNQPVGLKIEWVEP